MGKFTEKNITDLLPVIIIIFAVLSYGRVWLFQNVMWDDNCWLLSIYATKDIVGFLNTGPIELRRVPLGTFFYYFFSLHRDTNDFYMVWHSINMVTQIITPVFLYLFINNLFKAEKLSGFFIAISYILFPFDYTLPYASAINYRIGMMLSIISFYFTERALNRDHLRYSFICLALLISGLSHYIFIEGTIVFEPARLFVIRYIMYQKGLRHGVLFRKVMLLWIPFFLLCIPLVFYKLSVKQYGIYQGLYKLDPFFFLNMKLNIKTIAYLLFFQWVIFIKNIGYAKIWSILIGLLSIFFSYYVFNRFKNIGVSKTYSTQADFSLSDSLRKHWNSVKIIFLLGFILLFFSIALLNFAGREIARGMNSSHGSIAQFGYAIIVGTLLYLLYVTFLHSKTKINACIIGIALFCGLGVFLNNMNFDLYFNSWAEQNKFLRAFKNRFPVLPEKAQFMIDAADNAQYYTQLDNYYKLEFLINILYARDADPDTFYRYSVYTIEEFNLNPDMNKLKNFKNATFSRYTHLGKETVNTNDLIVVKYDNNKIFVNEEIIDKYPNIPYKLWAEKKAPVFSSTEVKYPLRYKIRYLFKEF